MHLGSIFKMLAQHLNFSDAQIENIEADHKGQREHDYKIVITWGRRVKATRTTLYDALVALDPSGTIFNLL